MNGPVDPRLLRHARSSRSGIALLALLGIGQALITIAVIVTLTRIVVDLNEIARSSAHSGLPVGTLGLLASAFAGRALLAAAEQIVAERTAARVALELRTAVLSAALERGPAWVAGFGTGRLAALLGGGLDALRPWFAGYLPTLVPAVVLPPLVLVAMALVDPSSALIAGLTLPLVPLFGALIGIATAARAKERVQAAARLSGHFLDVVRGLAALKLYGRAERQITVVQEMTERHRSATVRVLRIAFLSSTALDLVATLSVGLIAVAAGLRVAAGELGLGPALLVILLAPEAYRPLREVGVRFHAGADAAAVVAEVDAVLAAVPPANPAIRTTHTTSTSTRPSLDVRELRVRHPGARADALAMAALSLRGGELVALSGPSGAGKTTALRVFAGVQTPTGGRVERTGGRPLYLPQRPTLPHARSVADALLLPDEVRAAPVETPGRTGRAHPTAEARVHTPGRTGPTDADLFEALAAVGLADEISAMPAGLDTALGEHGRGLSSGQRQRLALARLLRAIQRPTSDPVLLLLDEPTAHLDPVAEATVIEQLRAATRLGYAVLVVAHRPALLAAVDRTVPLAPPVPVRTDDCEDSVGVAPTESSQSREFARARGGGTGGPGRGRADGVGTGLVGRVGTGGAIALGTSAWLAGVTLTGAASWLLVRAATLPPVLTLSSAVVIVRASAVIRPLARYLERLTAHEVAFTRLGQRRAEVFADLIPRVPGAGLHRRGELLSRIVVDVDARVDGVLRGRLPAAAAGLTLTAAGLVALALLPTVALALTGGLLIAAVLAPAMAARQATRLDAGTAEARAALADAVVETVDGLDELAGQETAAALRVPIARGQTLARIEARAARSAGTAAALAHLGLGIAVIGSAFALASAVGSGRLGAETAAVLLLGLVALGEPVLTLPDAAIARRRAAGARDRLNAVKALPRSATEPVRPGSAQPTAKPHLAPTPGRDAGGKPGSIGVRGLVAGWDPDRPPALTGLDLELPPESRTAVLGASGSGKSTLAGVLAGLLDPAGGTVRRAGARVALVGDEVDHVFASTVRENLRLSRPEASDDTLRAVLTRVRLDDWLAGLPHGLDSWLGEGGSTISGGEQRRLITARALLVDPDLLVLDEPTEGLDEPTAQALMADLLDATAGRRVLLLTHRTEGLDQVDVVHEFTAGRLRVVDRAFQSVMT